MKILTIQAAYFPMIGGAELFHKVTAEYCTAHTIDIDVLTCIWDKPDIAWQYWNKESEKINGVKLHRVRPWFLIQYLKSFGAIWPLYTKGNELIRKNTYDCIHAHIFPGLVAGALLKRRTGIPLIITIQGGDLADYSETGGGFSLLLKPIISWCLRQADHVHVVSAHLKQSVQALGVTNCTVIPNGVNTVLFKRGNKKNLRKHLGVDSKSLVIVSNSRLTPKNGLDLLIKAVVTLKDLYPVKLFILGGGEQERELKNLVSQLHAGSFIMFLGYLPHETTAQYLALADIFSRPSRDEGFGISFLEAMACGLPVVATRVGGIPDIITNEKEGYLIEPENVPLLSKTLRILCDDEKLREKMGILGREKVLKQYSWPVICNEVLTIYKNTIKQ